MKRLTDKNILTRLYTGVYYRNHSDEQGNPIKVDVNSYLEKYYMENDTIGFYSGYELAYRYGFTKKKPKVIEITTNKAKTPQRRVKINGQKYIFYKPIVEINKQNIAALRFLDLILRFDLCCKIKGDELIATMKNFIDETHVDFFTFDEYINLYPIRIYRNLLNSKAMLFFKEEYKRKKIRL